MARRASNLIGKPIVSAESGTRLGTVADLLLHESDMTLVGVVLRHGWLRREEVLPASSLQALGPDAVVSRSSELISAREWRERQGASGEPESRDIGGGDVAGAPRM